jgi:sigma-B regulation protein RsbU (phosphoserine phosphatase)
MELIHLSLVLVFTKPFETAWTIISGIAPSFLIINPLGLALLFVVINKFRKRIDDDKERHRIETELNVAKHIQASMLPSIFPPYPDKSEFDIFASMSPAKEVGGDLYDFFLVDDDHLGIVMGDVSGKGVPASLFMVITKTLIKDYALSGLMPAEVFNNVNRVLCEGNNEQLFVTAFFGIVTLPTGEFNYVNAGHNPPFIRRNGEGFTELEVTRNTVLAFIEDKKYTGQQTALALGDIIFVYTDGVTEAIDEKDNMYGTDKLAKVLNDCTECSVEELVSSVKVDVDLFVGKAPQFDDITMLALKYIGIKII